MSREALDEDQRHPAWSDISWSGTVTVAKVCKTKSRPDLASNHLVRHDARLAHSPHATGVILALFVRLPAAFSHRQAGRASCVILRKVFTHFGRFFKDTLTDIMFGFVIF